MFCVIEVSNRFNAKNCTSHREYSYYLPTFLLSSITELYLGKLGTSLKTEEALRQEDVIESNVVNGIKIVTRHAGEQDARDGQENIGTRDISHLKHNPEYIAKLYGHRLSEE